MNSIIEENIINKIALLINDKDVALCKIIDKLTKHKIHFSDFIDSIKNNVELFKNFLVKCKINHELFFIIMDEINKLKGKYKKIYSNEYKLLLIMQLEDKFSYWYSLTDSVLYRPKFKDNKGNKNNKGNNHYKSIQQQYNRWCVKDVFKNAFNNYKIIKNVNDDDKLFIDNPEIKDILKDKYVIDIETDFFIDSTNVNNKSGSENISINPENKKKKITKITEICDADGFIKSVCFHEPNTKFIKYLNKDVNTSIHDCKCINETLKNSNINTENSITLVGDKGYKTSECIIYNSNKVKIVTPNKSNQKNKLINRHDSKMLCFRHIVENSISGWKHVSRVNTRRDKNIINFMGWVYLSCLRHNISVNKIKNIKINKS